MKEGWIYMGNEKTFLQNLPQSDNIGDPIPDRIWHTYTADGGWKKLDWWEMVMSICEDLQGTCQSLMESCEKHNIDELEVIHLNWIEQEIYLCDACGWWYEAGDDCDYDGETFCGDCHRETINEDNLYG